MNWLSVVFASLGAALIAACATPGSSPVAPGPAAPGAAARIKADMAWLADDARQGREAGTPGYDAAADYVAREFAAAGLEPGADGQWRQRVPLRSSKRDLAAATFSLTGAGGAATLVHLTDYIIGRSMADARFDVEAPLVYVGYGIAAPMQGYDDYAGLDLAGKIVVAFGGAPRGFNSEIGAYYANTDVKMAAAAARGAIGFISIQSVSSNFPWDRVVQNAEASAMTWVGKDGKASVAAPAIRAAAFMNQSGAQKLFAGEAYDYFALRTAEAASGAPKGFALGKRARLAGAATFTDLVSDNVIGVIEGSDPELRDEVVLLTAHLDHVGVRTARVAGEDVINNGAMDNASGVAVLIEAAAMFKRSGLVPKRTIAFAAVTAEEKGLIGSDYLAQNLAFGGRRVVANVNLDMPVLLYPFTDIVAFGAERSSIGPVVERAAMSMGVKLSPDPIPDENIFVRSDHYSFVKAGVPSVFLIIGFENGGEAIFTNFLAQHYHRPSDDMTLPIRFDQAARFTDLNYRIVRALADDEAAPTWNDGDFFGELFAQ